MKLLRKKNTIKFGKVYHRQHAKNGTYFYVNTATGRDIWHSNDIAKPFKEKFTDFYAKRLQSDIGITVFVSLITIYLFLMLIYSIFNTK